MEEKIAVRVHTTDGWYKNGEIHSVLNHITFQFLGGNACFEKEKGCYGIALSHCTVIGRADIPEYTMEELTKKVGHEFKIKK